MSTPTCVDPDSIITQLTMHPRYKQPVDAKLDCLRPYISHLVWIIDDDLNEPVTAARFWPIKYEFLADIKDRVKVRDPVLGKRMLSLTELSYFLPVGKLAIDAAFVASHVTQQRDLLSRQMGLDEPAARRLCAGQLMMRQLLELQPTAYFLGRRP